MATVTFPGIVASVELLVQSTSLAPAVLYAVPSTGAGTYRLSVYIVTTTVGNAVLVGADIAFNNGAAAVTYSRGAVQLNVLGNDNVQGGTINIDNFHAAASTNITYGTTVSGAAGTGRYALRIKVEYLGA